MSDFSAGLFDKIFLNTGTGTAPTLAEIDAISDLDLSDEWNAIAVKLRRNQYESNLLGLGKMEISFDIATEPDNSVWQALKNAKINKTVCEVFVFYKFIDDGSGQPDTGSKAIRVPVYVAQFGHPQKLEDLDVNPVKLLPSANVFSDNTTTDPSVYTAA
jgi:hypothetical protein